MISNDIELHQTIEQMERMYRALAALRCDLYPSNPQRFALMAEGPQIELERLQVEIDAYTGRTELAELQAATS